jgi:hypothetical protein
MADTKPATVVPVADKKSRTVVVACKIPNGLMLQLQRPVDRMEDTRGGPEPRRYNAFYGRRYFVHGPAFPVGTLPKGFPRQPLIEGGYAITRGIPAEFWEQWLQQNKLAAYVVPPDGAEHGMIFAYPDLEDTAAAAREQEKLLSGMEPLSTDTDKDGRLTDPRLPKPINMAITKIGHEPHPPA